MKQIIIALTVTCTAITAGAQSFLNKVPANASVVLKYSGENFSKNLPLKKIDSYNFVKEHLFKALKIDTLTSLQNLGINFEKDTYQYVSMSDSSINFVTLLNLQSVPQFMQLVQTNYHAEMRPDKKNGYEFLTISPDTYLGWNDKEAVLVVTSYQHKKNYYDYAYPVADSALAAVAADSMVMVDTAIKFTPPVIVMDEEVKAPVKSKAKKPMTGKNKPGITAKTKTKNKVGKKKPVQAEQSIEETATDAPKAYYQDTIEEAKREAWYKEQEKLTAAKQKQVADSIINASFNSSFTSIEGDAGYKKIIDPAAHVSVWFNYENLLRQYWWYIFRGIGGGRHTDIPYVQNNNNNSGFKSSMNVYFEKDKMKIEQKTFSPDESMANLGKDLYSSKQNPAFLNYINQDNIGYISMSVNTEAMAKYYYKILKQYLDNTPFVSEYSDIVDVYVDLLEIAIDEKALSELMPGNMLFVLHDMKTKMVTYTDYVYDEKDFKSKEVVRTKQELSPDFTFVMETKKDGFMEKVAHLPLKYTKKGKYNYQDRGGYYELVFDKDKYPISSIYFMVKDGKAVVTTSKVVIDMTLNNTSFNLDADTKNSVLNNNYSLKLNSKKLIEQINGELSTSLSKKISKYFEDNMGDVKMESSLKDGIMQGTTTMGITGTHTNSLEFFFNMMDSINDIMEKDKLERDKKVD